MIITSAFLKDTFKACSQSIPDIDAFVAKYGDNHTYDFVIEHLKIEGMNRWAYILEIQKAEIIKLLGDYHYGIYQVVDPTTKNTTEYETLEEAQNQFVAVQLGWLKSEPARWSVNQEIENGDLVTWTPVDWETFSEQDRYQVFVNTTGQYELHETVESAKARLKELQDEFLSHQPPIRQQIIHKDGDIAWVNL